MSVVRKVVKEAREGGFRVLRLVLKHKLNGNFRGEGKKQAKV